MTQLDLVKGFVQTNLGTIFELEVVGLGDWNLAPWIHSDMDNEDRVDTLHAPFGFLPLISEAAQVAEAKGLWLGWDSHGYIVTERLMS